jgi:hypothetical protein
MAANLNLGVAVAVALEPGTAGHQLIPSIDFAFPHRKSVTTHMTTNVRMNLPEGI